MRGGQENDNSDDVTFDDMTMLTMTMMMTETKSDKDATTTSAVWIKGEKKIGERKKEKEGHGWGGDRERERESERERETYLPVGCDAMLGDDGFKLRFVQLGELVIHLGVLQLLLAEGRRDELREKDWWVRGGGEQAQMPAHAQRGAREKG